MNPLDLLAKLCECGCGEPAPIAKRTDSALGHVKGEPIRYIHKHYRRKTVRWLEEDRGYSTPCWIWQLATQPSGYGLAPSGTERIAHRAVYVEHRGPIPEGLELDHLCRVPACVNPEHLEPVTPAENMRRAVAARTACRNGHSYTEANTYVCAKGKRHCRTCAADRSRARRLAQRVSAPVTDLDFP